MDLWSLGAADWLLLARLWTSEFGLAIHPQPPHIHLNPPYPYSPPPKKSYLETWFHDPSLFGRKLWYCTKLMMKIYAILYHFILFYLIPFLRHMRMKPRIKDFFLFLFLSLYSPDGISPFPWFNVFFVSFLFPFICRSPNPQFIRNNYS